MESKIEAFILDKLRQTHLRVHDWQQESLTFVPLRGTWFAQSEHSFDLEKEINKFLSGDKKVLLLLGDSGSGKSLYTQRLTSKLWQDYKETDSAIPVWISLPSLKNPLNRTIEETFERFGFNSEQIDSLKHKKAFIFILDAFDEIHQLKNLWVSNHCDQWKAKIIITCRREYLYHVDNYRHFFTPFSGEKALYLEYDEIVIKPFSEEQIEQYIKQYIQHQKPEWSLEQYQKALDEIPGLKNLIKTPFLLKLAMEALPKMPQDKEQKYMTQAKLYDVFIEQWFFRQEQKLKLAKKIKENEDIKPEFWDYAKRLAHTLHQRKITQVTYDSSQSSDLFGETEDSPWQEFFNPENPKIELLRTACLVREVETHQYTFIHNSLLEYFMTRGLYEKLLSKQEEVKAIQEIQKSPQLEVKKPQDYFNERLLVEESNTLQFLADRVEEDEVFKKTLFDRVYASRKNPKGSTAASNAITILNRAHVSFSGMDFSDICATQADLNGAILSHTCVKDANLQEVILTGAYLGYADLSGANLEKAQFGEYPLLEYTDLVNCVCYSKDGQYMAVGSGCNIIMYIKKHDEYEKLAELEGHNDTVYSVAFSPDGRMLASGSADKTLRLWDAITQQSLAELKKHTDRVRSVAFSPDGKQLASGSQDNTVYLWDAITQQPLAELKGHTDGGFISGVNSVAFSPDGKTLASGSIDRTVRLWDAITQQPLAELNGHTSWVMSVSFSPDGKQLVSGSTDCTVRLWDIVTQQPLAELKEHTKRVNSVVFSPDGKMLASGSHDNTVRLWDAITQKPLTELKGHTSWVMSVAFSPDGKQLASSGDVDKTVRLWDAITRQPLTKLKGHTESVRCVTFSPDGKQLASGSDDKTLRLWDAITQKPLTELKGHTEGVKCVAFSHDGKKLASGSNDKTVRLWDAVTQQPLVELKGHRGWVTSVAFSPGGKQLVSSESGDDGTVRVWDAITQQPLSELKGHTGLSTSVAFSPDGKKLALSGSNEEIVRVWDAITQQPLAELKGPSWVKSVAFSPNGKQLASGNDDNTVCLWDTITWQPLTELKGHIYMVTSVAFSPDGKKLASGSEDKTVRLWDAITQQPLAELKGHIATVTSVAFSPDGKYLASGGADSAIFLWHEIDNPSLQEEKWILIYRFESSHSLFAESAFLKGTKISSSNLALLKQRGANVTQVEIVDVSDEQGPIVKMINKDSELKDERISTTGTTSSFWSSYREQVPAQQPPTPTKDTESKTFTF